MILLCKFSTVNYNYFTKPHQAYGNILTQDFYLKSFLNIGSMVVLLRLCNSSTNCFTEFKNL